MNGERTSFWWNMKRAHCLYRREELVPRRKRDQKENPGVFGELCLFRIREITALRDDHDAGSVLG
jgi:hypothetical protein